MNFKIEPYNNIPNVLDSPTKNKTELDGPTNWQSSPIVSDQPPNISLGNPKYPEYAIPARRLSSFRMWPHALKQRPEVLSQSGLYYTGMSDHTICFYCGGGIKDWEPEDVPWEEHAKWYPNCNFLKFHKGLEFISEIQRRLNVPTLETTATSSNVELLSGGSSNSETKFETTSNSENVEPQSPTAKTRCKICYMKEIEVVFLPCSHFVACSSCASALTHCAVCRTKIERWLKVFY